jgi:ABC-type Fe3+ transport system substrate-binding protein
VIFILDTVSVACRPLHPAAARLFVDFLFSKESQLKLRELNRIPSRQAMRLRPASRTGRRPVVIANKDQVESKLILSPTSNRHERFDALS